MTGNLVYNGFDSLRLSPSSGGGFQFVLYVPISQIQTFGNHINNTGYHDGLSLKSPNGRYYTAVLPPTGRGYTETQRQGDGGTYYDIAVTGLLPFTSPETELALEALVLERFVIFVQLPNNVVKIIGSPENPAKFQHNIDTGSSIKNVPATDISFTWQSPAKPPILVPSNLAAIYRLAQAE